MSEWKTYKLGKLIDIQNGYAFKSEDFSDKGIPIIKIKNIVTPRISFEECEYFDKKLDSRMEQFLIKKGDILISMTGSHLNQIASAVGKVGKYQFDFPALLNQRVGKLLSKDKEVLDENFFFYFISRIETQIDLVTSAGGSGNQANISPSQIKNLELNVPLIKTQKQIAQILTSLDEKIEINLQMNQTLEAMAQVLFKEWFVNFNFPGFDGEMVDGLPKGWKEVSLNDVIHLIIDHRGKTPIKLGGQWSDEGITALSAKNVKDGKLVNLKEVGYVNDELYEKWMKEKLNTFDILLTSEAPLGEVAVLISNTKYCLSQRLFAIRANEKCKPTYLYSFLRSKVGKENVQKRATGSTVVGIRQSELRNIEILLPNIETQIAFEEVVKPLLTKIDENYNETNILTQTRDTLLPKLMSGKIEVE